MLNEYFKQTMDHFGVKGTRLAKELGCGQAYISDIRRGKTNPPINRFWQILETMEKLAPGAKRYFGNLVAGNDSDYFLEAVAQSIEPAEMVELMSNDQLAKLMFAIANRIENMNKSVKKDDELMLVG